MFSRTEHSSSRSVCELVEVSAVHRSQELRYSVWRSEGVDINHAEDKVIADSHDDHAIHWGAFDGSQLVGAARRCLHNNLADVPDAEMFVNLELLPPVASMNRLVVVMESVPKAFHVEIVTSDAVLKEIAKLRTVAWLANGELPSFIANQDILNDEHDKHAVHFAVMHEGHPVAAGRICIHATAQEESDPESLQGYEEMLASPIATLSRLVIQPDFRGLGLGLMLTQARIKIAVERGCGCVIGVMERASRMRQMEDLGFKRLGQTKIRYLSYAESFVYILRL